jgi:hypothetical protein
MSERARSRVAVATLVAALSVTSAHALAATPSAASGFGTGTAVLLVLGLAAAGLTLFLNPFGAGGFVFFALTGVANTVLLVRSSLADDTERVAGSVFAFVVLIVIASHRSQKRIAEIRAKEQAALRERYGDGEWSRDISNDG